MGAGRIPGHFRKSARRSPSRPDIPIQGGDVVVVLREKNVIPFPQHVRPSWRTSGDFEGWAQRARCAHTPTVGDRATGWLGDSAVGDSATGWLGRQPAPPPREAHIYRCMDGGTGGLTKKRARQETGLKSSAWAAKNENKAGRSAPPLKTKIKGAALRAAPTKTTPPRARGPEGHLTGPAQRPFSRIWGPSRVDF